MFVEKTHDADMQTLCRLSATDELSCYNSVRDLVFEKPKLSEKFMSLPVKVFNQFSPRDARLSFCLSVLPSVTLVCRDHIDANF